MNIPRAPVAAASKGRQRRALIGLALLFFAPLALAFLLYYGIGWRPGGRVNHGELIEPARPLPEISLQRVAVDGSPDTPTAADFLRRKWTLLYWGAGACSELCKTDLYDTRQVRIALDRDMDRVQRVFVAQAPCCDLEFLKSQHPDLVTVRATAEAAPLLERLKMSPGDVPETSDRVYLIDPLGNVMMFYPPGYRPKGMLEDLKRLLGLSHVG